MKTKKNKKSGFTLVELMIVAAIIAILAAIVIPLLASNKDKAIAAEAANICGAVATELKTAYATTDTWPTKAQLANGPIDEEINAGRYFVWADVTVNSPSNGCVTVTGDGSEGSASGKLSGGSKILTLTPGSGYSGTMVDDKLVGN